MSLRLLLLPLFVGSLHAAKLGVCGFDGFENVRVVEETAAHGATAITSCSAKGRCRGKSVAAKVPVAVYRTEGAFTCGYVSDAGGSRPAWFRSRDLRLVQTDRNPPLSAWAGQWISRENHLRIEDSGDGRLKLDGDAVWHGLNDVVHTGEIAGPATPDGNRMQYKDDSCTLDLTLAGRYLIANDNMGCGGANVRFWGIWTRQR